MVEPLQFARRDSCREVFDGWSKQDEQVRWLKLLDLVADPSLVIWSLYEMRKIFRKHLIPMAFIFLCRYHQGYTLRKNVHPQWHNIYDIMNPPSHAHSATQLCNLQHNPYFFFFFYSTSNIFLLVMKLVQQMNTRIHSLF